MLGAFPARERSLVDASSWRTQRRPLSHPYLHEDRRRLSSVEMLLTVLLVLMVPGLLTYLVPERRAETARD